ncbi:MAG TPA: TlpA disulfide reductase family protein [Agitococcus sp.]|uniref:TlpA disulfide reductase family protein n=1 Tax=uncultured Agitococcus sp. TaxID=1506599 RepID=UPI00262300DF|nr:TlpA disulfide reductase family protein [uncultured Agitococcus sp.]HMV60262.1 TlpA disulfide reductase family protein [Agitococcus sp.]HNG47265.1 TlpA disulfide reductase family protein [Agitococcus sp.]HNL78975.1 TlpA disulfide reductase family protein [Agitococcus sp.]HRH91921.1 TlpA disulfide reductase family protein [Agitococcus sp.]
MNKIVKWLGASLLALSSTLTHADNLNLDSYKGKVVYVDFWASWCGPCRESFPWMKKMQQQYGKDGLVIIAINVDQDKKLADKFLSEFKPEFNVLFDKDGKLAEDFKVSSMPSSYVLDREGKPRFKHKGFHLDKQSQYETELNSLLKN